jgi:hypothetical protein
MDTVAAIRLDARILVGVVYTMSGFWQVSVRSMY